MLPVATKPVTFFHRGYARKMAAEPVFNGKPMFCNLCTRSSNTAIASAAVRANRRISAAQRRSSKNAMFYYRSQNRISVFPHLVSELTFSIAIHGKTNVGSTHTLVALRRGRQKGRCCHVHRALLPIDLNRFN